MEKNRNTLKPPVSKKANSTKEKQAYFTIVAVLIFLSITSTLPGEY